MPFNGVVTNYDDNGFSLNPVKTAAVAYNTAGLAAPAAPTLGTATSGGTVLAGTYQVVVTYVNAQGETVASASASQVTTGSTSTLTVNSPVASGNAAGWYAYVTQAGGSTYTRQQAAGSPTNIGTNLTLTAPPTSTGLNPPASNTAGGNVKAGAGRLAKAVVTTALTGSGGNLSFFDNAAGGASGTPLLTIPVAAGTVGAVFTPDLPVTAGISAAGLALTAGAVTLAYT
jgi:hypothetical protein